MAEILAMHALCVDWRMAPVAINPTDIGFGPIPLRGDPPDNSTAILLAVRAVCISRLADHHV